MSAGAKLPRSPAVTTVVVPDQQPLRHVCARTVGEFGAFKIILAGTINVAGSVVALAQACRGPYAELVQVLALQGLRWGELAGLQVGDRVMVPGFGCHGRF
jgi:hypothetical protein